MPEPPVGEEPPTTDGDRRRAPPRRRVVRRLLILACSGLLVSAIPFAWTRLAAAGHLYDEADAPRAGVVLVLGAQVAPGSARPMPVLRGRLETAAALVRDGRAGLLLVSGDAGGGSGDETAVMTSYLVGDLGVDPRRVVTDPHGLDTYDSCRRAFEVYGVTRALVVTQSYHLSRAVALCRHVGIDADGVRARCDGCRRVTLLRNAVRDYAACAKAALDALSDRPPGVESPPSPLPDRAVGLRAGRRAGRRGRPAGPGRPPCPHTRP